jgi:hypothetical protein
MAYKQANHHQNIGESWDHQTLEQRNRKSKAKTIPPLQVKWSVHMHINPNGDLCLSVVSFLLHLSSWFLMGIFVEYELIFPMSLMAISSLLKSKYDKNPESDKKKFLHQNQNIFFSNIGNQNIFLEKNHNLPLQVKWSFPYLHAYLMFIYPLFSVCRAL